MIAARDAVIYDGNNDIFHVEVGGKHVGEVADDVLSRW